jgi:hypothetical protein
MSHDLVYGFGRLTQVIFYIYFLINFFLISSFNIELIGN